MDAPSLHSRFLSDVLPRMRQDARVTGTAIGGPIAAGDPDAYSDVDLIVVIDDERSTRCARGASAGDPVVRPAVDRGPVLDLGALRCDETRPR
jgi:hypothetical protein